MPMDDILKQAFGSAFATNNGQAFQGGFQQGSVIADSIMKTDAQLQVHQQTLAMQQAQLQQKYLEKGSDLMINAGKDDTTAQEKTFLLKNANTMMQRAGLPGLSDGFMDAHRNDPEFASLVTKALTMKRQMDMNPGQKDTASDYGNTLLQISQMDGSDVSQWSRKLNDMTKDTTALGASVYRQGAQLQNTAILDRFKKGLDDNADISKLRFVPGASGRTLLDPSTGETFKDDNGNPLTMAQAANRLAAVQMGTASPSTADSSVLQAFTAQAGQYKAKNEELQKMDDQIQKARDSVLNVPVTPGSSLSKDVQKLINAGPTNEENAADLYRISAQVLSGVVTQKDQVERNRVLDDKAVQVKEKILTNLSDLSQKNSEFTARRNELTNLINTPGSTTAEISQKLRDLSGIVDPSGMTGSGQRISESEIGRVLPITSWQRGTQAIKSALNDASGSPLTQTQRNLMLNSLNSMGSTKNSAITSYLYDQGKQLNIYGPDISPRLKDLRKEIDTRISSISRSPSYDFVKKLYDESNNQLPQSSGEDDKHAWVINNLIQNGYNPVKAENIFFMKNKAGK